MGIGPAVPDESANVKDGPQMEIENFAQLVLFSNHGAPINIEEGDRRYFVFKSKLLQLWKIERSKVYEAKFQRG